MIISIASGKGGTGKTTVAVNLAFSINTNVQLLDCDVEEPNSYLFIKPIFEASEAFLLPVPEVDEKKCSLCGKCSEICQFKAITVFGKTIMTFNDMCHSCGGCALVCEKNAISFIHREVGVIQKGHRLGIELIHGKLRIGEAMSPPLIRKVRSYVNPSNITIIDAPPGTSCPVIASIKDSNFVLLVTEPTPFGLNDLKLAHKVVKILDIPCGLVINRSDIGDHEVYLYAKSEHLPILMEIPFCRNIAKYYSKGEILSEFQPEWKDKFLKLYQSIKEIKNEGTGYYKR
ncbi:MAG: ATP-binding protein [Desulfobacterales bacterium]|nr:ATP-binding protein [Desulfobacterales bacterium]MBF0397521.1 ATP-binding protein [Desulfobacterales bacterium]